jgi:hypothetical protein
MDLRKNHLIITTEGFRVGFGVLQMTGFKKISELKGIPLMVHKDGNFKYNID